jgi:hypothetical protein
VLNLLPVVTSATPTYLTLLFGFLGIVGTVHTVNPDLSTDCIRATVQGQGNTPNAMVLFS